MKRHQLIGLLLRCAFGMILTLPMLAKNPNEPKKSDASGAKATVKGVIVKHGKDTLTLRDANGSEVTVGLESGTRIEERKNNPFRKASLYAPTDLVRGVNIEVQGRREGSSDIIAERIRFRQDDLLVGRAVESTVVPVEQRVETAEGRLGQAEDNAKRMSGQLQELNVVSNAARGGAKAAQETADAAVSGVNATNERITAVDDYEVRKNEMINFKVNSATLTADSKAKLDEIANATKSEKGYVIEVRGFTSADGGKAYNRRLSQRRAEVVIQYLAENHDIPLRRIVTPVGYGSAHPVADNKSREGRQQNRRVEIKILVSRGLTTPTTVSKTTSGT